MLVDWTPKICQKCRLMSNIVLSCRSLFINNGCWSQKLLLAQSSPTEEQKNLAIAVSSFCYITFGFGVGG